jgi:lysophospholipase L1-like esterase
VSIPIRSAIPLAVLVAASTFLAGCNPADTPRARAGRCQVGIIGDSLTVGARDLGGISQKLYDNVCSTTAIDGKVSRSTAVGAGIVETWAAKGTLPSILVVELGTNDCSASAFERSARRIVAAAGPTRPIVWINTWRPSCDGAINGVIAALAAESRAQGSQGGRLWVLDHRSWIASHRELLAGDGLHLTTEGYRQYAQRIVDSLGIRRR